MIIKLTAAQINNLPNRSTPSLHLQLLVTSKMRKSTRQAKTAAKARLSGAIPSSDVQKNKKIVFDDDSEAEKSQNGGEQSDNVEEDEIESNDDQDDADESDDDNVEEVSGSAARQSTQKLRDAERKMARDAAASKRKRKTSAQVAKQIEENEKDNELDDNDEDEVDDFLTDDFLALVDSERADQIQSAKQDKKRRKLQDKKRIGKHTTFVVDDGNSMIDAPQKMSQNIEVVALGGVGADEDDNVGKDSRQYLISATLGTAPSKAAINFARGSLSSGTPIARGSSGKKRRSKKEETWKRSKKMNSFVARSRTGSASAFFARKR